MNDIVFNEHFIRFEDKLKKTLAGKVREKLINNDVITKRSRWATNAYLGAMTAGNPEDYCEQIATTILLDGLDG